jgi:hypothetical protein
LEIQYLRERIRGERGDANVDLRVHDGRGLDGDGRRDLGCLPGRLFGLLATLGLALSSTVEFLLSAVLARAFLLAFVERWASFGSQDHAFLKMSIAVGPHRVFAAPLQCGPGCIIPIRDAGLKPSFGARSLGARCEIGRAASLGLGFDTRHVG